MWVAFTFAKASHIFSAKKNKKKNKRKNGDLDIVLTRTVNILTTYKLVELTMLWTTGLRHFGITKLAYDVNYSVYSFVYNSPKTGLKSFRFLSCQIVR